MVHTVHVQRSRAEDTHLSPATDQRSHSQPPPPTAPAPRAPAWSPPSTPLLGSQSQKWNGEGRSDLHPWGWNCLEGRPRIAATANGRAAAHTPGPASRDPSSPLSKELKTKGGLWLFPQL